MDTSEAREFWKGVEEAAARVAKWPLWKRGEGEVEFAKQRAVTKEEFERWRRKVERMLEKKWGLDTCKAEINWFFDHIKKRLKNSHGPEQSW